MADPHTQNSQVPPTQTPLLNHVHEDEEPPRENADLLLERALQSLETWLSFLGFNQSSVPNFLLSWLGFGVVGVLVPVAVLELSSCSGCDEYQIKGFELDIVASQACIAAVSLICLSRNLRKYGIRRFLFVDRLRGHMSRFSGLYIQQIKESLRLLLLWSLPCFILKVIREVIRISFVQNESWWLSAAILLCLILSWSYTESDVLVLIEEHMRLRHHLSKISHRFRIFLLLQFCVVTASQLITLLLTTGYSGTITIINGGDFAVSSIVQVVGIILCLHAATRMSHRAQGLASLATRWHALASCGSPNVSQLRGSNSVGNLEVVNLVNTLHINCSESDLESIDYIPAPSNASLSSYLSTYHMRQAFVMYLQNNPGGITIFGLTVDRALIITIFFVELTLVTFVLGKTIVFSA